MDEQRITHEDLARVNRGRFESSYWRLRYLEDIDSCWYEARGRDGEFFTRGNKEQLLRICEVLNGKREI